MAHNYSPHSALKKTEEEGKNPERTTTTKTPESHSVLVVYLPMLIIYSIFVFFDYKCFSYVCCSMLRVNELNFKFCFDFSSVLCEYSTNEHTHGVQIKPIIPYITRATSVFLYIACFHFTNDSILNIEFSVVYRKSARCEVRYTTHVYPYT